MGAHRYGPDEEADRERRTIEVRSKQAQLRPNLALREAAEEADRNMHVFRRGLAIRAARRAQQVGEQRPAVDERIRRIRRHLTKLAELWADRPDETLSAIVNRVFDCCGGGDYRRDMARLTHDDVEYALDRAQNRSQSGDSK